jgi:thymidylate synthase (FAD)
MSDYKKIIKLYEECGDDIGEVSYIQHYGSDRMILNSAKVSYGKEIEEIKDKDVKLIKYLLDNHHSSPLESCGVTFKFTVPMFIKQQHARHRTWKWWAANEISRRYTSENIQFYMPQVYRKPHEKDKQASVEDWFHPDMKNYSNQSANDLIAQHVKNSLSLYEALLSSEVAREMARMVLPQNLYTEYYGTCNLNNLLHFLTLRNSEHSQWEIRVVAQAVEEILTDLFPITMGLVKNDQNT